MDMIFIIAILSLKNMTLFSSNQFPVQLWILNYIFKDKFLFMIMKELILCIYIIINEFLPISENR